MAVPVVTAACFFSAGGPWAAVSTRPSLHPLASTEGGRQQDLGSSSAGNAELCPVLSCGSAGSTTPPALLRYRSTRGIIVALKKLSTYRKKRDFEKTAEPSGDAKVAPAPRPRFVIQKDRKSVV